MKVIKKNNQEIYKYKKHEFGYDTKISIMFFVLSIMFLSIGVLISYLSGDKNFYPEVRNILVLTVLYLVMWIIMI